MLYAHKNVQSILMSKSKRKKGGMKIANNNKKAKTIRCNFQNLSTLKH